MGGLRGKTEKKVLPIPHSARLTENLIGEELAWGCSKHHIVKEEKEDKDF